MLLPPLPSPAALDSDLGKPLRSRAQGLTPSFLQYQTGVLATAMDHLHSNQGTDSDLYLATGACTQMATYMRSSGIDASIQSSFAGVSPAMIPPNTTFDPNAVYNALQAFVPSMGLQDFVNMANFSAVDSSEVPAILSGLQQNGLAFYLDALATDFRLMGDGFYLAPAAMDGGGHITSFTLNPGPPQTSPPSGGGGVQ